jgi:flagellar basal-body rod modification protein FlgD
MTLDGLAPTATSLSSTSPASDLQGGGFDRDAFMKLLIAQVRYQDPTKPIDSTQFIAQTAQFTQVEQMEKMAASQAKALSFQQVLLSSSLIGREVVAVDGYGQVVAGQVTSVNLDGETPSVVVEGMDVPIDQVSHIR